MFELSVAFKYLRPRWRQLSVSIISMISILVIALVVWLIVVFFSVTNGLEKMWINKLIALTAPVRVIPTQAYYNSYYYQIDSISSSSDYTLKSIGEKLESPTSNAYDAQSDEEIPKAWPKPILNEDGSLKDLVKDAFQAIHQLKGIPGISASDFEMTVSNIRLRLLRRIQPSTPSFDSSYSQAFLSQAAYLGSLDPFNPILPQTVLPLTMADLTNTLNMIGIASDNIQEDAPETVGQLDTPKVREKLHTFFDSVQITSLKTPQSGWNIPKSILPSLSTFQACMAMKDGRILRIFVPKELKNLEALEKMLKTNGFDIKIGSFHIDDKVLFAKVNGQEMTLPYYTPLILEGGAQLFVETVLSSLSQAKQPKDIKFLVSGDLQGNALHGEIILGSLEIAQAKVKDLYQLPPEHSPFWFYKIQQKDEFKLNLPLDNEIGEGVLLPKTFRDAGVLLGDRGYLSYYTPTASSVQEQRMPIFIAGFYDPGIIPMGGKYILASQQLTSLIRSSHSQEETSLSNGINVRFADFKDADKVKQALKKAFQKEGIEPYWRIETYREFEFTKDLIQQMHSDKNLFTLIATVIIIVACSNIISMLIILVNDKKVEIGILRSMGASSFSIAAIFGLCGMVMGVTGSIIGTLAAIITLKNLDILVALLSKLQGYNAFNPVYYGDALPNEFSWEALLFVILATGVVSLLAGIVPAVKASLLRPSAILRSE